MESMHSGFTPRLPGRRAMPTFLRYLQAQAPLLTSFARTHQRQPTLPEAYALTWLSIMDRYVTLRRDGVPFLPVRYEDLTGRPRETLVDVLTWCGLPTGEVDSVLGTFATDSQEGTALSRASRAQDPATALGAEDYARVRAVLADHPTVRTPDFDAAAPETVP